MAKIGWSKPFEDPITLPNDRKLLTLLDAGNYINSLPRKESAPDHWQVAVEALLMAAQDRGPIPAEGENVMNPADRFRQNADDCRQRSLQARMPADKAIWLKLAEEWQRLAEEVDFATHLEDGLKAERK